MLPGVRFLFVAMVLSLSVLVFGLGATALMRAAHEVFATDPSWRAAPETKIVQASEPTPPELAMLQLDSPIPEPKLEDQVPAIVPSPDVAVDSTTDDPMAAGSQQTGSETRSVADPGELTSLESAGPDASTTETPAREAETTAAPAQADQPALVTAEKTLQATDLSAPAGSGVVSAVSEQSSTPAPSADNGPATIASLDTSSATIETKPQASPANANGVSTAPDRIVMKKWLQEQERRAAYRRRMALRARLARQAQQQALFQPFVQPPAPAMIRNGSP